MSAAQGVYPHLAKAPVQYLPFPLEVFDSAGDVLDGYVRVHPVLVEQVDSVGS